MSSWFEEQINKRRISDEELLQDTYCDIAGAILGRWVARGMRDDRLRTKNAIDEILKYYHIPSREIPDSVSSMEDQLDYLLRPHGIMWRPVKLSKGWYHDAAGPMLASLDEEKTIVSLLPDKLGGYRFRDPKTGKRVLIRKKNAGRISEEGIVFYEPFPERKLSIRDLIFFVLKQIAPADILPVLLLSLFTVLIGLIIPALNSVLFGRVIEDRSIALLLSAGFFLLCASLSSILLTAMKELFLTRIGIKAGVASEAAAMMRVLTLPAGFFRKYSSGEIAGRLDAVKELCALLTGILPDTIVTSLFSLLYITQIAHYAPSLTGPAILVILTQVIFSVISAMMQMRISRRYMEESVKENGLGYALIRGIRKIRLAGAEKRAFSKWGKQYAKMAGYLYSPPLFLKINSALSLAIGLAGTFFIYAAAVSNGVGVAEYYAFNAAYGMLEGAFMSLAGVALAISRIRPVLTLSRPLLETEPEVTGTRSVVSRIAGGIELSHVSFRYEENMPMVLEDLSLKIRPGQYVAIVGRTGCGKSTLLRLLLGFEKPAKGAVYYDGRDLSSMDLRSLRRKIGVVLQDGKLFEGDLYSNIALCAPSLTMEEAWEAARIAGIDEDIRNMPMGMQTRVAEDGGGISGGQRQRILIARAIASKPKILMFDEATSALDNLTQKKVSDALSALKCTRLVIAHRLSTIRECDRIIVLEKGQIIEDGTYEELIAKNGFFAELVERQRMD